MKEIIMAILLGYLIAGVIVLHFMVFFALRDEYRERQQKKCNFKKMVKQELENKI